VVLSACNTAGAGDTQSGEALSGLGRAFLYAGARALLVPHWAADWDAAVLLTTRTFAELKSNPASSSVRCRLSCRTKHLRLPIHHSGHLS
jgi:CHAT domain-containing protein